MTLAAAIDAVLPVLRAEAEGRMSETVTVGVFVDTTDPATGNPVRTATETRYSGKARIRYASRDVQNADVPGQPVSVQDPYLSVPVGTPAFRVGDEVVVTAAKHDSALVGRTYVVQGRSAAGQVTASRYPLTELS